MFRDAKEELRRLEAELLAAEREESEQARADRLLEEFLAEEDGDFEDDEDILAIYPESLVSRGTPYRNFSNNYGRGRPAPVAYNTDSVDEDLEEYSDEVYEEPKDDLRGLILLAMVLLAGILGMLAFWAVRYL